MAGGVERFRRARRQRNASWNLRSLQSRRRQYVTLALTFLVVALLTSRAIVLQRLPLLLLDMTYTGSNESSYSSCQTRNRTSDWWTASLRLGNKDTHMDDEFVRRMLLYDDASSLSFLLEQSICQHDTIPTNATAAVSNTATRRHWALQLLYLLLHDHQHRPAQAEARSRFQSDCPFLDDDGAQFGVGRFDYECPPSSTRYLLLALGPYGLGSTLYQGAIPALLLGVLMDRVVLLINRPPGHPTPLQLRQGWASVSCADRADHQCAFLPMSPCVLTTAQLRRRHVLMRPRDLKHVEMHGELPPNIKEEPVVIVQSWEVFKHRLPPPMLSNVLASKVEDLIQRLSLQEQFDATTVLETALDYIRHDPDLPSTVHYTLTPGARAPVSHVAALLYVLRPNRVLRKTMASQLEQIFPPDYVAERSLGLPMRASDKCLYESHCLAFDRAMQLALDLYHRADWGAKSPEKLNLVLTTESAPLLENIPRYQKKHQSFPFRFILNKFDVLQGSGHPAHYPSNTSADQVMLSTMVAIQMQLRTRHLLGDCCSNMHNMMLDLQYGGCGSVSDGSSTCWQELVDPRHHRVCCPWSQNPECQNESLVSNMTDS